MTVTKNNPALPSEMPNCLCTFIHENVAFTHFISQLVNAADYEKEVSGQIPSSPGIAELA